MKFLLVVSLVFSSSVFSNQCQSLGEMLGELNYINSQIEREKSELDGPKLINLIIKKNKLTVKLLKRTTIPLFMSSVSEVYIGYDEEVSKELRNNNISIRTFGSEDNKSKVSVTAGLSHKLRDKFRAAGYRYITMTPEKEHLITEYTHSYEYSRFHFYTFKTKYSKYLNRIVLTVDDYKENYFSIAKVMKDKASEIEKSIEICVNMDAKDIIDAENSNDAQKTLID
jgi:hypothetical protein